MEWAHIRAELERAYAEAKRRGLTQKHIAARGGLKGQNAVSKVLSNEKRGPTVEVFTKVVEGFGFSLSEFFTHLERRNRGELTDPEKFIQGSYAKATIVHSLGSGKA